MTGLEHAGATGASHRRLRRGHRAADNPARMDKAEPIAVIGAGAWGTALAQALAADGRRVALWARREDVVAAIRGQRENTPCLPGVTLHAAIAPSTDLAATLAGATTALLAVPAAFAPAVAARIRDCGADPQSLTIAAKGFAQPGSRLLGDAIAQTLPGADIAVLSGPSFAQDVARGLPTAIVLAARTPDIARALAARLATPRLRIYASDDPVGVQIGGALKNVVAIACGIVVGRGLGESARAVSRRATLPWASTRPPRSARASINAPTGGADGTASANPSRQVRKLMYSKLIVSRAWPSSTGKNAR